MEQIILSRKCVSHGYCLISSWKRWCETHQICLSPNPGLSTWAELKIYADYCNECSGLPKPIETWEERLSCAAPTMHYWKTVTDYLLINCRFVWAQQIGDWPLVCVEGSLPIFLHFGAYKLYKMATSFSRRYGMPSTYPFQCLWCFSARKICHSMEQQEI